MISKNDITELKKRVERGENILNIKEGSLKDRVEDFDEAGGWITSDDISKNLAPEEAFKKLKSLKPLSSPFNFNLPNVLRDYLEYICALSPGTTMTKYLVEVIYRDMDDFPFIIRDIPVSLYGKNPDLAVKAIRCFIAHFERNNLCERVYVTNEDNSVGLNEAYNNFAKRIRAKANLGEQGVTFDAVVCHPNLKEFVEKTLNPTPWKEVKIITMDTDELLYRVILAKNKKTEIFSINKSGREKDLHPDEHGDNFYNKELIQQFLDQENKKEESKYKAVEVVHADGTSKFYISKLVPKTGYWEITPMVADTLEGAKRMVEDSKKYEVVKEITHEL